MVILIYIMQALYTVPIMFYLILLQCQKYEGS